MWSEPTNPNKFLLERRFSKTLIGPWCARTGSCFPGFHALTTFAL